MVSNPGSVPGCPTPARLQALLAAMIARLMRLFVRRGVVVAEPDRTWIEETQDRDGDDATGMAAVPPCLVALEEQADVAAAALPQVAAQWQTLDARVRCVARLQHRSRSRQSTKLELSAADRADEAVAQHQHAGAGLARGRAKSLRDTDPHDIPTLPQQGLEASQPVHRAQV